MKKKQEHYYSAATITTMKRKRCEIDKEKKNIDKPLSNFDIENLAIALKIPHFHGVFMRDTLLKKKKKFDLSLQECWILNHGSSQTDGTHWTALAKNYDTAFYFDSFGKLPPPFEVVEYLNDYNYDVRLYYNAKRYQNFGTSICGQLCLRFLYDFWRAVKREEKKIYKRTHST